MLYNLDIQFFAVKFLFFANFFVCLFLYPSLFNVRYCWRRNGAGRYVFQLADRLCNVCFKPKHLFLLFLHLVDN